MRILTVASKPGKWNFDRIFLVGLSATVILKFRNRPS